MDCVCVCVCVRRTQPIHSLTLVYPPIILPTHTLVSTPTALSGALFLKQVRLISRGSTTAHPNGLPSTGEKRSTPQRRQWQRLCENSGTGLVSWLRCGFPRTRDLYYPFGWKEELLDDHGVQNPAVAETFPEWCITE